MKARLLTSTVIPLTLAAGVAIVVLPLVTGSGAAGQVAANPCAAKRPANPCSPCAASSKANSCAAANPCNPCAAKRAANPCNPCGATAAGPVYSSACVVPRLVAAANPCAAKRATNPCNPCGAKSAANPCNPCAAGSKANPCAAKRAANPCNPCSARSKPSPCNPCGAAAKVTLTPAEVTAVYNCLRGDMKLAYGKSGNLWAKWYRQWKRFSKQPYASSTHGGRFVSNYASRKAAGAYGRFDQGARMTKGGVLAKDSFSVTPQGRVSVGPLFLMEKMGGNFNSASGNWRYTMITPNGVTLGTTNGKGSKNVKFCIECHAAVAEAHDSMFFVPAEFRAAR